MSKLLADGPMRREDAVRVMMGVGHALAAAHRVGVVHRDLKPDNVMLVDSQLAGVSSIVKVLDFGIALVAKGTLSARITGDLSVGTPPYMAPEQFSDSTRIGPHTDVWAMGLLLFEMLTGQRFWQSNAKQGGTLATLIQEIVEQPIAPSAERAREKNATIDPPLAAWIDLCLQREPSRRFDDAQRALDALAQTVGATHPARIPAAPSTAQLAPTPDAAQTRAAPLHPSQTPPAWLTQGGQPGAQHTIAPPRASQQAYVAPPRRNTVPIVAAALAAVFIAGALVTVVAVRRTSAQRDEEAREPSRAVDTVSPAPQLAPQQPAPPRPLPPLARIAPPEDLAARAAEPPRPHEPSRPTPAARPRVTLSQPSENAASSAPPSDRRPLPPLTTAQRDAQLRAVVFRAIREAGCFNERTISTAHGSVMLVVHEDGHIVSAQSNSNAWSCLVRARLTTLSAPRWSNLYRASFPLNELYR